MSEIVLTGALSFDKDIPVGMRTAPPMTTIAAYRDALRTAGSLKLSKAMLRNVAQARY